MTQDLDQLEPKPDKIFFLTLNANLPSDLFAENANFNIQFVTTKSIKNKHYVNNDKVRTLEELLYLCKAKTYYGQNYKFSTDEIQKIKQLFAKKLINYSSFELLKNGYQKQINNLDGNSVTKKADISTDNISSNVNYLENVKIELLDLEKFKEFMESWQIINYSKNQNIQSPHNLSLELLEKEYRGKSFFEIGSEFIEQIEERFEEEWKEVGLNPFQNVCITYLSPRIPIENKGTKEMFVTYGKSPTTINSNAFLNGVRNSQPNNNAFEELRVILTVLKDHIDAYHECLIQLNHKHDKYKRDVLYSAILQMSAVEKFLVTKENSKSDQVKYLFSPSYAHYLINPKETLLAVVKDDRGEKNRAIYQLNKYKDAVNKYLFTLDTELPAEFFSQCIENRIKIVTTKSIKEKHYANNERVIVLEHLLALFQEKTRFGQNYNFLRKEREKIQHFFEQKLNEDSEPLLLKNWYRQQISMLESYQREREWGRRVYS